MIQDILVWIFLKLIQIVIAIVFGIALLWAIGNSNTDTDMWMWLHYTTL